MVYRHWSPPLLAPTAVACSLPCPACAAGAAHCSGVESWARAAVRYLQSTHWYLQYLHTDIFSIYTLISRYLGCNILCLYVPWPHVSTGSMSPVASPGVMCEDARRQCWHDHGAQLVPAQRCWRNVSRACTNIYSDIYRYLHRFMIRRTFRFSQQMKSHSILLVNL